MWWGDNDSDSASVQVPSGSHEQAQKEAVFLMRPTVGNHKSSLKDRKDDCYETPPEATKALIQSEHLPHRILEPACGPGAIVKVLRDAGHYVVATDLVDYGCPESQSGVDFLMEYRLQEEVDAIVTNPPFKIADDFVRKGLELCPSVIILQRLMFLEGKGRSDIIDGHLVRIHVFRNRLPMMHRAGWSGKSTSSMAPYAWFIFSREKSGPTLLDRISSR